ncbi:hypothetical protein DFAR_3030002 [Desulfarculales bacterium]
MCQEISDRLKILGAGATGSGRYLTADFIGANIVRNEIIVQATAAVVIDPKGNTIFEIGGQDSKLISLKNGVIVNFMMNKVCVAGTGPFWRNRPRSWASRSRASSAPGRSRPPSRCAWASVARFSWSPTW